MEYYFNGKQPHWNGIHLTKKCIQLIFSSVQKNRRNGEVGGGNLYQRLFFVKMRGTHFAWNSYTAVQVHIIPATVHLYNMYSCLPCTLQLPGGSLASVLSTKPLKASPNTGHRTPKAGYRGGGTPTSKFI
jgi:hypothetical protein